MKVSRAASCAFASSSLRIGGCSVGGRAGGAPPSWPGVGSGGWLRAARRSGGGRLPGRAFCGLLGFCAASALACFGVFFGFAVAGFAPARGRRVAASDRVRRGRADRRATPSTPRRAAPTRRRTPGPGRPRDSAGGSEPPRAGGGAVAGGGSARPPTRGARRLRQRPLDIALEPPPRLLGLLELLLQPPDALRREPIHLMDRVEPIVVDQGETRRDRGGGERNADVDRLDRVAERQSGHDQEQQQRSRRRGSGSTSTRSAPPRACPRRSGRSRRSPWPRAARRSAGGCVPGRSARRCRRRSSG